MKVFTELSPEITEPLERFRKWAMLPLVQESLEHSIIKKADPYSSQPEFPASAEYLKSLKHSEHIGFPLHMRGIDINYKVLQNDESRINAEIFEQARQMDRELDDQLQVFLGAKFCALKAFYPKGGYIGWHNNWNAAGYNIIFTYSETGNGYWRHIEPSFDQALNPSSEKIVHIQDPKGWHCKAGYFGAKTEPDKVLWHCATTHEPRLTISYVIFDQAIWQNMVNEIGRTSECLI